jgi:hypothetical protein
MTKQQDNERRLENLELQVESLMEQHLRTDRMILQVNGAITGFKWLGAGAAGLYAVLELIWTIIG